MNKINYSRSLNTLHSLKEKKESTNSNNQVFTAQIGVNILGFPLYYESIIYQNENKFTGKTKMTFKNQIITQR